MQSDDVDVLINAVRQGQTDAFGEVVRMTQHHLRAYIAWLCPFDAGVDDIAQEVYVHAYAHLHEYRTGTDFLAWLRKLAKYRVLRHLRSVAVRAKHEHRYTDALLANGATEMPSDLEAERLDALKQCLQTMPANMQELVKRRYEDEEPIENTARLMGRNPEAIRIALFRIREKLRDCVEQKLVAHREAQA